MIDQKHLAGTRIRVYDPPLPLYAHPLAGGPINPDPTDVENRGPRYSFRDFDASKVEIGPDGSMTLSRIEETGEELDIKTGRKMQGYRVTLLAIIDADGHLRAETIHVDEEQPQTALRTLD
jgi:hypothetical protein